MLACHALNLTTTNAQVRAELQAERDEKIDLVTDRVKREEDLVILKQQHKQVIVASFVIETGKKL